ncbi:hypothetical protein [Rummeliibacillus sp. BSL5]
MKSKFTPFLLSGIFLVSSSVFSNTASATSENPISVDDTASTSENSTATMNEIKDIANQTDSLELVDVTDLPENTPFINFDSIEDFQKAIADLEQEQKQEQETLMEELPEGLDSISSSPTSIADRGITTFAASQSRTDVLKVTVKPSWNPLKSITQPATVTVNLTYNYKNGAFTNKKITKSNVKSHSFGVPTSWVQEDVNSSYYDSKKGVKLELIGYNVVGLAIKGQPVGAKIDDIITFKYKIGGSKTLVEY